MKSADDIVGGAIGLVVATTALTVVLMLGTQTFDWLKNGLWPAFPISDLFAAAGIPKPVTTWKGAQQIMDFVLSLNAAIAVVVAGMICSVLVYWFMTAVVRLLSPLPPRVPPGGKS